jgi:predicted amidophosphoribosyltransferase
MFEYTSGKKYDYSATNNLISNLKKKPGSSSFAELQYKANAIKQCAACIASAVNLEALPSWTIVPVPPSKHKTDLAYDDRMLQICNLVLAKSPLDIRELVVQSASTVAAHEVGLGQRLTVTDLTQLYSIDESITHPAPKGIIIVDDVLTAGTHYRAMHTVLSQRFPGVPIHAIFVARRVFPPDAAVSVFTVIPEA